MQLNEHRYCVAATFKMTEQLEQWLCIKFCIKLEHSFAETNQVIQKATAMGNWWLAVSLKQCARSCITHVLRSFWWNIKSPRWPSPYSSDLVPCNFCFFPKLKPPVKQNWFQIVSEIQENTKGQLIVTGRTV